MITLDKPAAQAPDDAYLTHVGHLATCDMCKTPSGLSCPTGTKLRRAVTRARTLARWSR